MEKLFTAWASVAGAFGINSWADAASFAGLIASTLAAIYTFCLLAEFFWKRLWKPLFTMFGWISERDRSQDDEKQTEADT